MDRQKTCLQNNSNGTYVRVYVCGAINGDVFGIKICMCIVCGTYLGSFWGGVILGRGYIGVGCWDLGV